MTRNVYTVSQPHSLHTAISIMKRNHVSRVIVSRNNEPIGIITSRDIMPITAFVEGEDKTEPADLEGISHIVLVRDVMKKPLITLNENEDLAKAAGIMTKNRISGIPIVNVQQQLVGIITKTDIVRAICDLKKSNI
jgi:CBS domain-containing protein